MGGGTLFVHTLNTIASAGAAALSNAPTLAWLAAGAATAHWLSLFTFSQPIVFAAHRSGRRNLR
jgi:hypothetical protein